MVSGMPPIVTSKSSADATACMPATSSVMSTVAFVKAPIAGDRILADTTALSSNLMTIDEHGWVGATSKCVMSTSAKPIRTLGTWKTKMVVSAVHFTVSGAITVVSETPKSKEILTSARLAT